MPNDYYNFTTPMIPNTKVRSDEVNTQYELIEDAFDKLQDPSLLGSGSFIYATDSGSADTYILTNNALADEVVLQKGQLVSFTPLNTNTGPATITLNNGTANEIVRNDGSFVQANDILDDVPLMLIYDIFETRWVMLGASNEQIFQQFRPTIEDVSGIGYTVSGSDESKLLMCSNSATVTVTVPVSTSDDLPDGFICHVYQHGTGQVVVVGEAGVTLHYPSSAQTRKQYSSLSIIKVSDNDYHVIGDAETVDTDQTITDTVTNTVNNLGVAPGRTYRYYRLTIDAFYEPEENVVRGISINEIILEVNGFWVQMDADISIPNVPSFGDKSYLNNGNINNNTVGWNNDFGIGKQIFWDFGDVPRRLTGVRQISGQADPDTWIGAFTLEASDDNSNWVPALQIEYLPSASAANEISQLYIVDWDAYKSVVGTAWDTEVGGTPGAGGGISTVVGGTDISVDSSDPANPVVSYSGSGGGGGGPDKSEYYVKANGTGDFLTLVEAFAYFNSVPNVANLDYCVIDVYLEPGEDQDIDEILLDMSYPIAIRRNGAGAVPNIYSSGNYIYVQGKGVHSKLSLTNVRLGNGTTDLDLFDLSLDFNSGASMFMFTGTAFYSGNLRLISYSSVGCSIRDGNIDSSTFKFTGNLNMAGATSNFSNSDLKVGGTFQIDGGADIRLNQVTLQCATFQASNPANNYPIDASSDCYTFQANDLALSASTGTTGWQSGVTINTPGSKFIMGTET